MRTYILSAFLCLTLAVPAMAQQHGIEPDRPGVISSPYTVPQGTLQAELGALNGTYLENDGFKQTTFNFPLQLRYGITSGLELRLRSEVYQFVSAEVGDVKDNTDGFGNITAGIKYTIPAGQRVNVVVIPEVTFPVAEPQIRQTLPGGTDNIAYRTDFVARFDMGASPLDLQVLGGLDVRKVRAPSNEEKYFAYGRFAGQLGGRVGDAARVFAELGFFPQMNDFENRYGLVGIGAEFMAAPNVSFDIFGNRAFASDGPFDWGFGAGVSTRF